MSLAAVIPLRSEPLSRLDDLLTDHRRLLDEEAGLKAAIARLEPATREAEPFAAKLRSIEAAEAADAAAWARSGDAAKPDLRHAERAALDGEAEQARARAAAAHSALHALQGEIASLAGRMRLVEAEIAAEARVILEAEADGLLAELAELAPKLTALRAKVLAHRENAVEIGHALLRAGQSVGGDFLGLAERLAVKHPEQPLRLPTNEEISDAFNALRAGVLARTGGVVGRIA